MKALFILTFLTITAHAGSIGFQVSTMTVNAPGFTAGATTTGAMNKETTTYTNGNGASFATSLIRAGIPDATYGGVDFFWAQLTNTIPFSDAITVAWSGVLTVDGHSAPVTFSGQIGYTDKGMAWLSPPAPFSILSSDGKTLNVSFITNQPGLARGASVTSSIDLQILGTVAEVPEPGTIGLLLLGLAGVMRRKKR